MEKVVIFFLKAQGEIASKLLALRLRMRALGPIEGRGAQARDDDDHRVEREGSTDTTDSLILKSPVAITPTTPMHRRRMYVRGRGGGREGGKEGAGWLLGFRLGSILDYIK